MPDMKTRRQWRVPELMEKEKVREGGEKVADVQKKKGKEEEIQTRHCGSAGDLQI